MINHDLGWFLRTGSGGTYPFEFALLSLSRSLPLAPISQAPSGQPTHTLPKPKPEREHRGLHAVLALHPRHGAGHGGREPVRVKQRESTSRFSNSPHVDTEVEVEVMAWVRCSKAVDAHSVRLWHCAMDAVGKRAHI